MGTPSLQQLLRRTLCFNPHWKYAVFWKLNHMPRMGNVLTWEDGWLNEFHSDESSLLRSAMSSYRVYSLGEGTVGKVAASGEHAWTFSHHHHAAHSSSSPSLSQHCGEWEAQFSAGIKASY
ncbi:hypothetical protein M569_16715 [Genlisea aurea]|uniref:Transcription factor MYC/MYB N-terminal domain-containing protein n=1 Tax=Genlisea aurea TaxID=192259 RepID=S8C0X1_9LAMI|nr:hypothetical protein M569_16715 [Genlisea aurea]